MMKKTVFIIALITIGSCKKKNEVVYNLDVPRNKMVAVLRDISIAEATVKLHSSKNKDSLKNLYFTEIYTVHQLEQEKIEKEFNKMLLNVPLQEELQREVLDSLKKIQTYKYRPDAR